MKEWKTVQGTQTEQPTEVDTTSSPTTVYLRRNIAQKEVEPADESGETMTVWEYEERELTTSEYQNMLLMQQTQAESAATIIDTVTAFQKDAVIDEYTEQLIEEGTI